MKAGWRAAENGRDPATVKVLPGFSPLVGRTEKDAQEQFDYLQSLVHPVVAREYISMALKADLSQYPLDGPVPDLPLPTANGSHSSFMTTMALARRENLTIRQLGMRMAAALVDTIPLGVDTPADLERARQLFRPL